MDQSDIFFKLSKNLNFKSKNKKTTNQIKPLLKKPKTALNFFNSINENDKETSDGSKENEADSNNDINWRKKFKIFVEGSDVPDIVTRFDDLKKLFDFDSTCIDNITEQFKFTSLTPVQMQVCFKLVSICFLFLYFYTFFVGNTSYAA